MDLTGVRVLVVDDHEDSLDIEQELLEWAGAEVVICRTSDEARAAWEEGGFDVVVTDLCIPDRGGGELLRSMRATGDTTPALALSSWPDGFEREANAAGFDRFLEKPVATEVLIQTVGELAGVEEEPPVARRRGVRHGATSAP